MSICICSTCSSNCIPSPLKQGEYVTWSWTLCDYPSAEYDLQFRFRGPGTGFDIDTEDDDDSPNKFVAEEIIAAGTTVGTWKWQAWVTEIANPEENTFAIASGTTTIETGFVEDGTATFETRSPAKIALDTIDAALLAFATSDVTEYEVSTPAGSKRVKRSDKAQLLSLRKHYASIVAMERTRDRIKNGGTLMRSVPIIVREC